MYVYVFFFMSPVAVGFECERRDTRVCVDKRVLARKCPPVAPSLLRELFCLICRNVQMWRSHWRLVRDGRKRAGSFLFGDRSLAVPSEVGNFSLSPHS